MHFLRTIQIFTLVEFLCLVNFLLAHEQSSDHTDSFHLCGNQYSEACNVAKDDLTNEEMFRRGHMKPFGSHSPPDYLVEELPYMISPEDFYMNYVAKHKPVVFKGAVKYWPAFAKWTDEYLNSTYGSERFNMETRDDDKWNIPPDMRLDEFLSQYNQSNRYLVDEVLPDMRKDVILPLCLRCEEMSSYFFVSYFWMSTGGTSSAIHIDTDENLLCVIHGHKAVLMVSPVYSTYLYSDEARVLGVSDINPQAVDLEKYPNVMKIKYHSAMVEEGDIVYIPQMWWHQVISRPERQQAVALWWKSKPSLKKLGRLASPLQQLKSVDKEKYSFGNILAEYELWVQNVSDIAPRLECKAQQVFMSDYQFESDNIEDAPQTQGDGGHLEEELGLTRSDLDKPENNNLVPCDFDYTNKKSPCHFSACWEEDETSNKCIRYILDYCLQYDDRGCVLQLPQLMTKLGSSQYKEIQQMPSDF